jgi:eukaryotic-like serine/threonine-protein kinase
VTTGLPLPTLVTDRFSLMREVGRGGMGVVYEAVEHSTGQRLALKLLPRADAEALFIFKREFRSLAEVSHPNLLAPYELVAEEDQWFFTMELLRGGDVLAWVRDGRSATGTGAKRHFSEMVNEARLRSALEQLAHGVGALHTAGMLHRDLKPSNVLVREDGRLAILDFGLTVDLVDRLSTSEQSTGTIAYMAPEQLGDAILSSASDWYAVGLMLYEAMTGQLPFPSDLRQMFYAKMGERYERPETIVDGIPPDLAKLCEELLRPAIEERATGADILSRLGGPITEADAVALAQAPPLPVFLGRDAERARLTACGDLVRSGQTGIVYLHGRSGAGKSALLQHWLVEQRADPHAVVLSGRCYELESVPFKAIDTIVDSLTRWLLRLPLVERDALLPGDHGALVRVFPVLERAWVATAAPGASPEAPDPREVRRRGFAELRTLLSRIGDRHHLVIAIDDLQWGDVDSAELLASLLDSYAGPPLRALFVAAFRSEYRDSSACLAALTRTLRSGRVAAPLVDLSVEPLSESSARALAAAMLQTDAPAAIERIAVESAGNPFFIGELARYANEHPDWLRRDAAERFDLEQVLRARVARLPLPARHVLEVVAIAGQPVRNGQWRDAVEASALDPRVLAQLRRERLIRSTGVSAEDEVETYHDRIRVAVTASLSDDARCSRHHALAEALERQGHADSETIATHFANGGAPSRAWPHFERAAHAAARALAFDRAATLFAQALERYQGPDDGQRRLLAALGQAQANAGRGREAGATFDRAAALATTSEEQLELKRRAAAQYCVSGSVDVGRARFGEVLRGVGLRPARASAWILAQLMVRRTRLRLRGLGFTSRAADAVPPELLRRVDALWAASTALSNVDVVGVAAMQSQALLLALEAGEPRRLSLALGWEAVMTATSNTKSETRAAELLDVARDLASRVDDPLTRGMVLLSSGWVAFLRFRFEEALATCTIAERVFREECVGAWWELLLSRTLLAWGMAHTGRVHALAERIRAWEPEARARGDHFLVTNLLSYAMPHERMLRDDVAGARAHLREAMALWPYEGFHIQHVSVLFSEGMLSLYTGDGEGACRAITEQWGAMVSSLQTQNQQTRVMLRDVRARGALMAAAQGHAPARYLARAERDAATLDAERAPFATAYANRVRAGVALQRGRTDEAVRLLTSGLPAMEAAGLHVQALAVRRRVGQLVGGTDGEAATAQAAQDMRARGVANVDATTRLFAIP